MRILPLLMTVLCIHVRAQVPDTALVGHWNGVLEAGIKMRLAVEITAGKDGLTGTFASLDQSTRKVPLVVTRKEGVVRLELPGLNAFFEGTMDKEQKTLTGHWNQNQQKLPLVFTRSDKALELKRPQNPKPPFPYTQRDVSIESTAKGVKLAGTLTIPAGDGPHPAVVLITGSGPQDRDESLMGHRPFWVLADHLSRNGVAVLRCDDRGFARSTGNLFTATTPDFAEDTRACLKWLATQKEIDPKRLGLIGHSEGGVVAPMVAAEEPSTSFIVLLAGMGVPGKVLVRRQTVDLERAAGADQATIDSRLDSLNAALKALDEEKDPVALEKRVREIVEKGYDRLSPEKKKSLPEKAAFVQQRVQLITSPWQRWFLNCDPAPYLRKVKCPVLAINGELDLQVAAKDNLDAIAAALAEGGNKSVTTQLMPGLNHLFQACKTGAMSEYGEIEETINPKVLELISTWIAQTTRPR